MKFRQRMAWLLVLLYLAGSFGLLYYVFEINDCYNILALDHVEKYHSPDVEGQENEHSAWRHATDIPLALWAIIFVLPYLQVFFMILACTKMEPRLSFAFQWPGTVYIEYQKLVGKCLKHKSKSINSSVVRNGHVVIDT